MILAHIMSTQLCRTLIYSGQKSDWSKSSAVTQNHLITRAHTLKYLLRYK